MLSHFGSKVFLSDTKCVNVKCTKLNENERSFSFAENGSAEKPQRAARRPDCHWHQQLGEIILNGNYHFKLYEVRMLSESKLGALSIWKSIPI